MRLRISFWIAFILVTPCLSQTSRQSLQLSNPVRPFVADTEIPFKLYEDYLIVVKGTVGSLEERNLLIDTGANPSAIDRRVARKLRLSGHSAKLALYGQDIVVQQIVLPRLEVGPIEADALDVLVQDLTPIEKRLGVQIDAIIGFDVLSRRSFAINYSSRRITFGSVQTMSSMIPFSCETPKGTVEVQLFHQSVHLLIDTGAPNVVLFGDRLPARLRRLPTNAAKLSRSSAATSFELREVPVSEALLGQTTVKPQAVFLTDGNVNFGQCLDGVAGPTSLGLKWIAFDFEHQRFAWKR